MSKCKQFKYYSVNKQDNNGLTGSEGGMITNPGESGDSSHESDTSGSVSRGRTGSLCTGSQGRDDTPPPLTGKYCNYWYKLCCYRESDVH